MWKRIKNLLLSFAIKGLVKAKMFEKLFVIINGILKKYAPGHEINIKHEEKQLTSEHFISNKELKAAAKVKNKKK